MADSIPVNKYIGYLRYTGDLVSDGILDAKQASDALRGFDEILRFFITRENSQLQTVPFEIPVLIQKGSWEAVIPEIVSKILSPTGIAEATSATYLTVSAKKAATDGFLETGAAKDIAKTFKAGIRSAQWVIKIATHLKSISRKDLNPKIIRDGKEIFIEIPNEDGKTFIVPKKYYDLFMISPVKLFSNPVRLVEKGRIFELGVYDNGKEEKVTISEDEKGIFYSGEEEEVLFPELKHGQSVELEGTITKGNEKSNTIGFEYLGHILTAKPAEGSIVNYKNRIVSSSEDHIFPRVKISGVIDRAYDLKEGELQKKRPMIVFIKITPIDIQNEQQHI